MPLAKKETGYPVDEAKAAEAVVKEIDAATARVVEASRPQPSLKDRSIVRQVAWKIVGPAVANWAGTPEAWFEKCVELRAKVEKDILEA